MIILRIGFRILGFYHLITHAVFKSLLLLCADIIIRLMKNNQNVRCFGIERHRSFCEYSVSCFYFVSDGMPVFGWVLF